MLKDIYNISKSKKFIALNLRLLNVFFSFLVFTVIVKKLNNTDLGIIFLVITLTEYILLYQTSCRINFVSLFNYKIFIKNFLFIDKNKYILKKYFINTFAWFSLFLLISYVVIYNSLNEIFLIKEIIFINFLFLIYVSICVLNESLKCRLESYDKYNCTIQSSNIKNISIFFFYFIMNH